MKQKKNVFAIVRLQIPAGKATPSPPIGPVLGSKGIRIMDFCNQFNNHETVKSYAAGTPLSVVIEIYSDKTFTFLVKSPPTSYILKQKAGITKGSDSVRRKQNVGSVTMKDVLEIAEKKKEEMNLDDVNVAASSIIGTASSIGIEVLAEEN